MNNKFYYDFHFGKDYYEIEIPASEIQNANFSSAQNIFNMISRVKKK